MHFAKKKNSKATGMWSAMQYKTGVDRDEISTFSEGEFKGHKGYMHLAGE